MLLAPVDRKNLEPPRFSPGCPRCLLWPQAPRNNGGDLYKVVLSELLMEQCFYQTLFRKVLNQFGLHTVTLVVKTVFA